MRYRIADVKDAGQVVTRSCLSEARWRVTSPIGEVFPRARDRPCLRPQVLQLHGSAGGWSSPYAPEALQAVSVLVPIVVAIVSTFRLPTLERRTRRHMALVKEMPEGVGQPMRQLLEDELAELARRDALRLAAQEDQIVFALRLALFIPLAGLFTATWLTGGLTNGPAFQWGPLLKTYAAILLAWIFLAALGAPLSRLTPPGFEVGREGSLYVALVQEGALRVYPHPTNSDIYPTL